MAEEAEAAEEAEVAAEEAEEEAMGLQLALGSCGRRAAWQGARRCGVEAKCCLERQHPWAEAWMVAWRSRPEAFLALCLVPCLEAEASELCYWRSAWVVAGRRYRGC